MRQFVYLLQAGPFLKVGVSINPWKRAAHLKTGLPLPVDGFRAFRPLEEETAESVEEKAHKILANFSTTGEWFEIDTESALQMIGDLLAEEIFAPKGKHKGAGVISEEMTWEEILETLNNRQISDALGCSVQTVSTWRHRSGPVDWLRPILSDFLVASMSAGDQLDEPEPNAEG